MGKMLAGKLHKKEDTVLLSEGTSRSGVIDDRTRVVRQKARHPCKGSFRRPEAPFAWAALTIEVFGRMMRNGLLLIVWLCLLAIAIGTAAAGEKTYSFVSARNSGAVDHVAVQVEVGGNLQVVDRQGKTQSIPVSGLGQVEYHEKTLAVPDNSGGVYRSVRHYTRAAGSIKVGSHSEQRSLRAERSLIAARADDKSAVLFCPSGHLTRDELDIIDLLANSLLVEQLLPSGPVPLGFRWKVPGALLSQLCCVDAVTSSDVEAVLKEVTDTVARFELSGSLSGRIDDVTTQIELKGKYRYDLRLQRIDWLGLLVKEQREIGKVQRGFDVISRVQVRILPAEASPAELADERLRLLPTEPDAAALRLVYPSQDKSWQVVYDRNWHMIDEHNDVVVFLLLRDNQPIAQCRISMLPQRAADKLPTLEQFQDDLRASLRKYFKQLVEARQYQDDRQRRVYRVVIEGEASEIPVFWIYYWIADSEGRQAVLAFTGEQKLADRLGPADGELVAGFEFTAGK